jgi:aspartyl-tRNA(Asn)/glutamyl-tRNA(Gln) amidotransferase subunit C
MSIGSDEIKKIAHLARLEIRDEQVADYEKNISNILDLVAQMDAVDTDGDEPMSHPLHMTQRLREDAVTETNKREALQAHSPAVEEGHFLVPKVIE